MRNHPRSSERLSLPLATTPTHTTVRRRQRLFANAVESLESRRLMTTVSILASDATASEAGLATGKFTVTRDDSEGALTVNLTIDGSATPGTDYVALPTTVKFADGVDTATLTVTPKQDTVYEGSESVYVEIAEGEYDIDVDDLNATVDIADDDKPTITIKAVDDAASEGTTVDGENVVGVGKFTISRGAQGDDDLPVKLTIAGTAANGSDYKTIEATATIPEGEESVDITVTPIDDNLLEGPETLKITIATDATYVVGAAANATATVNIADNEKPSIGVTATDATAVEGSTTDTFKYTITRTGPTTLPLTVKYTMAGTATKATDYDDVTGTVIIPAGKASVDIVLKTKQDTTYEGSETAQLKLSVDDAYFVDSSTKAATATITDDDKPTVSLVATDVTANEVGVNKAGKFVLTRNGPTTEALTVNLVIAGTAKNGADYKTITQAVKIPAKQSSVAVWVKTKDDADLEGDETAILTLGSGAYLIDAAKKTGTVTIGDDEVPDVGIVATDAAAAEPADKGVFTITRTGPLAAALTVKLAISGSATGGTDYETIATSVVIPAGKPSVTINVTPKDDESLEGNEKVVIAIADDDAYDQDPDADSAAIVLADNEKPTVTLTASDATAAEKESATGEFTVTRTGPTTDAMVVPITIAGTAANGTDYSKLDTTVTIPAGEESVKLKVTPTDDSVVELDETVIATLVAGKTYNLGDSKTGTVTIAENDLPVVTLVGTDVAAAESGDKATLTVSRTGPTNAALSVTFAVTGTATSGTDYAALTSPVVIPAGKASATLVLVPTQDTTFEGVETAAITLTAAEEDPAYVLNGDSKAATVKIADDELPSISLEATDTTADEADDEKTGEFTITRDGPTDDALDVLYTVTGTATTGKDTTEALTGKVTIPAGKSSVKITITGKDDTLFEGDETVILTLKDSAKTYKVNAAKKTGTVTMADGDKPTVSIAATKSAVKENGKDALVFTVTRTGATTDALTVSLKASGGVSADDVSAALPTSVTIPAGKLFSTVTIAPKDDKSYEGTETLKVTIDEGTAYVIDESADDASGTIADDDLPTISITATDTGAAETDQKTGKFTVSRGVAAADDLTVTIKLGGTAKNGRDYVAISKTVTIKAGESTASITVKPKTDSVTEGPESVVASLVKGAGYTLDADAAKQTATVTIADAQKATVSVAALDASIDETSNGTAFRIWRTGRTVGAPLTVKLGLTGTAEAGDYTIQDEDGKVVTTSVVIPQGESYVDVYVTPVDNTKHVDDDLTVILTVGEDDAYTVDAEDGSATITIVDDDEAPSAD